MDDTHIKKVDENIKDINVLNKVTDNDKEMSQVNVIAGKFGDKIKGNLQDIVSYKEGLDKLWEFKKKKSQSIIEECEYNEYTKFYKWINPKIINIESGKYYISSSNTSNSRIVSHIDDSKKYTNQEVISTSAGINPELAGYGPLLVSFTLKEFLDKGGVLCFSDRSNMVFQFRDKIKVPITIENDTEWIIDIYAKYQSLFDTLYKGKQDIDVMNNKLLGSFSVYDHGLEDYFVRYEIMDQKNTIVISSESENIKDEQFMFALLGIIISNGLFLKKDNIVIERGGNKFPFNEIK